MDPNPSGLRGTIHSFTFDLETTGLRTRSYTKGVFQGRRATEPIGVSSISYGYMGQKAHVNAFTDLVTPEMLARHGVSEAVLLSGELPPSLLREIVRDHSPSKAPKWDPSLRERGSVVDRVFRRHASHVLRGGAVQPQIDVYRQLANEWSGIAAAGGKVELAAWNVGYDVSTLFREMRRHGLGNPIDDLLKTNSIRVREMAEGLQAARFETMLRTNWTPVMTDRSVFKAAVAQGLEKISPAQAEKLGAIRYHTGLREFMDDVRGGREAFKSRATKWLATRGEDVLHARASMTRLVDRMGEVKDWNTFRQFVAYGQEHADDLAVGDRTVSDVLRGMYGGSSILGDPETLEEMGRVAGRSVRGATSGFSFIGGGRLGEVSALLLHRKKELSVDSRVASEIDALLSHAHEEAADRRLMEVTAGEIDRIRRDSTLFERWMTIDQQFARQSTERRVGELYQDFLRDKAAGPHVKAAGTVEKALSGGGSVLKRHPIAAAAGLAFLGAYFLGEHNKTEEQPRIEGMGLPESEWNTLPFGIDPDDLPFSNVSAFGSGYDHYRGAQIRAPYRRLPGYRMIRGPRSKPVRLARIHEVRWPGRALPALPELSGRPIHAVQRIQATHYTAWETAHAAATSTYCADHLAQVGRAAHETIVDLFQQARGRYLDHQPELWKALCAPDEACGQEGYGGYVQMLSEDACGARIRDHATQLHRLPYMPRTPRVRRSHAQFGHCERSQMMAC